MRTLAELQRTIAHAMTTGDARALDGELDLGIRPRARISIHLRHYEASLTAALLDKFPACAWLLGSERLTRAARAYVRERPPRQPCIAEYGADFPAFLARIDENAALPYLESFAALEWAVGRAAIATSRPPCSWDELASIGAERLVESALTLQPGLHHCEFEWRVDELMTAYLRGEEPERFVLEEERTYVEIRGKRGVVGIERLEHPVLVFRTALAAGRAIGDAAAAALDIDPAFDAGAALRSLVGSDLVTGLGTPSREREAC